MAVSTLNSVSSVRDDLTHTDSLAAAACVASSPSALGASTKRKRKLAQAENPIKTAKPNHNQHNDKQEQRKSEPPRKRTKQTPKATAKASHQTLGQSHMQAHQAPQKQIEDSESKTSSPHRDAEDEKESIDNAHEDEQCAQAIESNTVAPAEPSSAEVRNRHAAWQYLTLFSTCRAVFKFMKIRQSWILKHLLDREALPKQYFKYALEYCKDLKGQARSKTLDQASQFIKQYEASQPQEKEEQVDEQVINSRHESKRQYQRARQIVELLA